MRNETTNNAVRPWASRLTEHDYGLASIILYQDPDSASGRSFISMDPVVVTPIGNSDASDQQEIEPTGAYEQAVNDIYNIDPYASVQKIGDAIPIDTLKTGDGGNAEVATLSLSDQDDYIGIFNNFSLNTVNESAEDITKLHVNFSEYWNLFFFGQKPKVYQFGGVFLDSREFPYYQEFMVAYDKYLRGRKCVENKMQMVISYQGKVVSGYLLSIKVASTGENAYMKQFGFSVIVRDEQWVRNNYRVKLGYHGNFIFQDTDKLNVLSNKHRFRASDHRLSTQVSSIIDKATFGEIDQSEAYRNNAALNTLPDKPAPGAESPDDVMSQRLSGYGIG